MSSVPRKRFISNNIKKIFTVDKISVKKLQFFTPGLPQDSNIIFPPVMRSFSLLNIQAEGHSFAEMRFIPFSTRQ